MAYKDDLAEYQALQERRKKDRMNSHVIGSGKGLFGLGRTAPRYTEADDSAFKKRQAYEAAIAEMNGSPVNGPARPPQPESAFEGLTSTTPLALQQGQRTTSTAPIKQPTYSTPPGLMPLSVPAGPRFGPNKDPEPFLTKATRTIVDAAGRVREEVSPIANVIPDVLTDVKAGLDPRPNTTPLVGPNASMPSGVTAPNYGNTEDLFKRQTDEIREGQIMNHMRNRRDQGLNVTGINPAQGSYETTYDPNSIPMQMQAQYEQDRLRMQLDRRKQLTDFQGRQRYEEFRKQPRDYKDLLGQIKKAENLWSKGAGSTDDYRQQLHETNLAAMTTVDPRTGERTRKPSAARGVATRSSPPTQRELAQEQTRKQIESADIATKAALGKQNEAERLQAMRDSIPPSAGIMIKRGMPEAYAADVSKQVESNGKPAGEFWTKYTAWTDTGRSEKDPAFLQMTPYWQAFMKSVLQIDNPADI
jgi:hypothetical protein